MTALPTVGDVAQAAGVSRQTVSNVLNAPQVVRDDTRDRVQAAIDRLGYRPHASARRLRTRVSSTIGVRLPFVDRDGVSGAVLDRFLHELAEHADARGMRIMLFAARDHDDEIAQYRRLRDGADVDAVVVTATSYDDPRIDWLATERMPFVAFGRPWGSPHADDPGRPWVDVDGFAGTREATAHLLGRGLRRIGWLGWPEGSGTGEDRRAGWAEAMAAAGVDAAELEVLSLSAEDVASLARSTVERRLGGRTPDAAGLDALVCASDSLALGAMMAVREAGHPRFPVVGFDNTPVSAALGLSSVDQCLDLVAIAALELLLGDTGERVLPPGDPGIRAPHRLIPPRLVVRRSTPLTPTG
ncbi:MAG: LacI family DNA-binding transcriptional regulator [Micrococcales bacterium]|nr:LacI family DNA-binding transcriptional regulator [Micrococcales bacterium]